MAILDIDGSISSSSSGAASAIRIQSATGVGTSVSAMDGTIVLIQPASAAITNNAAVFTTGEIKIRYMELTVGTTTSVVADLKKYRTIAADIICTASMQAYRTDRDILKAIRESSPPTLQSSTVFGELHKAQGISATRLFALVEKLLSDYFVDNSTPEGLILWEKELDIKPQPTWAIDKRRSIIKSRLQGLGVMTKQRFEQILTDSFYVCSAEERPAEYKVLTTILSKRGVPADITDMEALVDDILPAHLVHGFIFTWLPWNEVEQVGLTWDDAGEFTWDEFERAFLVPFSGVN